MQWIYLKGYKCPLWLAVLARLVQARTAGRPAGVHCACNRVASGFHALRAGGRVRNPLVPPCVLLLTVDANLMSTSTDCI